MWLNCLYESYLILSFVPLLWVGVRLSLADWLEKLPACLKSGLQSLHTKLPDYKAHPILKPNMALSESASSWSCHLIMPLASWRWQNAVVTWNKTWEEAAYIHFPATCCSSFCCFSCQWSQTLKKWCLCFKEPVAPCVNMSLYLYCSALLEQLSRLLALLPNRSSKTTHKGTCILVRYITHYINLHHWEFAQTA